MFPCTCQQLPPCAALNVTGRIEKEANRSLLISNLQQYGWSPIATDIQSKCIRAHSQQQHSHHEHQQQQQQHQQQQHRLMPPPTRAEVHEAFQLQDKEVHYHRHNITYRGDAAESGDSGTIEPKESLEVTTSSFLSAKQRTTLQGDEPYHTIYHDWFLCMHQIALQVQNCLGWPAETLLCSSATPKDGSSSKCLDLLRIFFYHAVPTQNKVQGTSPTSEYISAATDKTILGSSPHTDWGSLTIVWQDNVGGLQTWCHKCKKWSNVPASTPSPDGDKSVDSAVWNCIVHVGDVTSLVIPRNLGDSTSTTAADGASANETQEIVTWPSPKHRVVSPDKTYRASLVYFAYPPSHLSLKDIHQTLLRQPPTEESMATRHVPLPVSEYYILRDQAVDGDRQATPHEMYTRIYAKSVGQVLQDKWSQVQR